jgi:hypothetical protein
MCSAGQGTWVRHLDEHTSSYKRDTRKRDVAPEIDMTRHSICYIQHRSIKKLEQVTDNWR